MAANASPWDEPVGVDTTKPNAARMYDWYLGGGHNFEVDREFGRRVEAIWPNIKPVAKHNRAFMQRVVKDSIEAGIRQFIDIGSGVPTVGNVHEITSDADPIARVVYVDYEPVAFAAGQVLLEEQQAGHRATVIQEDLREPDAILNHPETQRLINFDEPVCLLTVALFHFVSEADKPGEILASYREALAPGSRLGLTHIACDEADPEERDRVLNFCEAYKDTSNPLYSRDKAEVTAFFDGWDVLEPGVVFLPDWRPYSPPDLTDTARKLAWCGVGELRK
ncbi:MAG TPA: SAM-dependent methyltransferase [Pseudonocardiaceae bacterium]